MAWHFDEVNDRVVVSDDPALDFPDGPWTIAGFIKPDDNDGTAYQYFLSTGGFGANPSINIFIGEASASVTADQNDLRWNAGDDDTTDINTAIVEGRTWDFSLWVHVIITRTATAGDFNTYVDGVEEIGGTTSTFDAISPSELQFGSRTDEQSARFFGGDMAEWAKWDVTCDDAMAKALAAGYAPTFFPDGLSWYVPMFGGDYTEKVAGLTVTNVGSTAAAHPPMIYPNRRNFFVPAVGGGIVPILDSYRRRRAA